MKTLSVRMIFWHCSRLNSEVGKGARDFLAILRESGGEILRFWPPPKQVWEDDPYSDGRLLRFVSDENETLQAHPEPEKEIDRQGNFNATFSNRFLTRSAFENKTFKDVPPTGNLDYFQNGRFLWLSQLCRLDRPQNVNDVAHGQLGLGKMLYPRLCPTYGWIDEAG
ncbi:MAG TPA: hypothetical protein VKE98_24730, partial [Gemmataceae bacterium]|nr:hypothetical protein [Gemmataceae bacterium]